MTIAGPVVEVSPEPAAPARAAAAPIVALGASFIFGALYLLHPLLWQVVPTTPLPPPWVETHQDAEWLTFLVVFAVLLPLGLAAGFRLADRITAGAGAGALEGVAALLSGGAALVVVLARITDPLPGGGGQSALVALGALWWVGAALVLRRATSGRPWPGGETLAEHARTLWWAAGVLLAGAALCFTDLDAASMPVLIIGLGLAALALIVRAPIRIPPASARVGAVVDLALLALLLLAVPNLVVFVTGDPELASQTATIQFHQNFFLGPANQVLAGDAMLVEVLSQYGVGSIYFLTGAFLLIPIGNGTLGLIEGALSALMFAGTFATLRMAGVSRVLAGAAMTVAVVALVYGLDYPLGGLLQHGAFRFGMPLLVIAGVVAEVRWPRAQAAARGLQVLGIALAWVWAFEALAYTMLTLVGLVAYQATTLPVDQRRGHLRRWAVLVLGIGVLAHLLLAVATFAAKGVLPDWGWYLNTLREFLMGSIGIFTFDFSAFSWGLLLGAAYLGSATALTVVAIRRSDIGAQHPTTMLAICGMTVWGIALFSYLVNRSADHIIPYVSLPAVALGALWLSLAGRPGVGIGAPAGRAALASAVFLSALLVAVAWPSVGDRYPQSALAHVVPGGDSLTGALDRLRSRPPIRAGAVEGEQLLERFLPGEDRSVVLTGSDLSIEILMRAERGNAVPLGDPIEDSFVPDGHFDPLQEFIDGLEPGTRVLIDAGARRDFEHYRADPSLDPLDDEAIPVGQRSDLARLQRWVIRGIGERFDLRRLATDDSGLEVVELVPVQDAG